MYIFALSQNPRIPVGQVENPSLLVTQVRGMAGFLWRVPLVPLVPPAATSSFKVLLCDAVHIALPAWEGVA